MTIGCLFTLFANNIMLNYFRNTILHKCSIYFLSLPWNIALKGFIMRLFGARIIALKWEINFAPLSSKSPPSQNSY